MKNFVRFLGGGVLLLVLSIAICSCTKPGNPPAQPTTEVDSVTAVELYNTQFEEFVNPTFTDVSDVLTFQNMELQEANVDEVFLSMPQDVLSNVTTVVLKKLPSAKIADIVVEYLNNRAVYDGLHTEENPTVPASTTETTTAVTEGQPATTSDEVSYHYETDTLPDGTISVVKVETKRIRYE